MRILKVYYCPFCKTDNLIDVTDFEELQEFTIKCWCKKIFKVVK